MPHKIIKIVLFIANACFFAWGVLDGIIYLFAGELAVDYNPWVIPVMFLVAGLAAINFRFISKIQAGNNQPLAIALWALVLIGAATYYFGVVVLDQN